MMIETEPGDIELANDAFCRLLGLKSAAQSLSGLRAEDVLARGARSANRLLERVQIVVEGKPGGAVWLPRAGGDDGDTRREGRRGDRAHREDRRGALGRARGHVRDLDPRAADGVRPGAGRALPAHPHLDRDRDGGDRRPGGLLQALGRRGAAQVALPPARGARRAHLARRRRPPRSTAAACACKVEQDVSDTLEGDVERLQLILKNLLDNAFALLPGAEITLQITPEYVTESGIQLSFSVVAAGPAARSAAPRARPTPAWAWRWRSSWWRRWAASSRSPRAPTADALYAFTIEFPVLPAPAAADARHLRVARRRCRCWWSRAIPTQRLHALEPAARLAHGAARGRQRADGDGAPRAPATRKARPIPLVILSNRLPVQDGFLLAFRIKHHPQAPLDAGDDARHRRQARRRDRVPRERHRGLHALPDRRPAAERGDRRGDRRLGGRGRDADAGHAALAARAAQGRDDPAGGSRAATARSSPRTSSGATTAAWSWRRTSTEALAALDQDVYDMVLVDTSLTGLDGPRRGEAAALAHHARSRSRRRSSR